MKKEEKDLLLRDLCARFPYGVICTDNRHGKSRITEIDINPTCEYAVVYYFDFDEYSSIESCRPYLRPMSSMTEKEKDELLAIVGKESDIVCEQLKNNDCGIKEGKYHYNSLLELNWLIENHFDFRGLIPLGLALEAPEGMYTK